MITIEQIRAARGLLDWTQQDLADHAGVPMDSVKNFESGKTKNPRDGFLEKVEYAFVNAGIMFIPDGVRYSMGIRYLDDINKLLDDVYHTLKESGGEVLITGVDEAQHSGINDYLPFHIDRLQKSGIKERLLICEGDMNYLNEPESYRWVPKDLFNDEAMFYVYDKKYAVVSWGPPKKIVLIEDTTIAKAQRASFEHMWRASITPPKVKK